jgi:hypothetical protein
MANATSVRPAVARSDGTDDVVFAGNNFSATAQVVLTTPLAELHAPTGYEDKHGGNYDATAPFYQAPAPTPLPVPGRPLEQVYLMGGAAAAATAPAWRQVYPIRNDAPVYAPVVSSTSALVVADVVANHAVGYYVRVRVASTVDRSHAFTDRAWVPFFEPTVEEVYPPTVPKSGAVITLLGHSFGTGGRVLLRQNMSAVSAAALADGAFAGLHALLAPGPVPGAVDVTCLVLAWDHYRIRCLAPPGADAATTVVVDLGVSSRAHPGALEYRDAAPCGYAFTYSDTPVPLEVATFLEEYQLGVWSGLALGLGLWLALWLLLNKVANRDPRLLFSPSDVKSPVSAKGKDKGGPVGGPAGRGGGRAGGTAAAGVDHLVLDAGAGAATGNDPLGERLALEDAAAAEAAAEASAAAGPTDRESKSKASGGSRSSGFRADAEAIRVAMAAANADAAAAGVGDAAVLVQAAEPVLSAAGAGAGAGARAGTPPPTRRRWWRVGTQGRGGGAAAANGAAVAGSPDGPTAAERAAQEQENRDYLDALSPISDSVAAAGGGGGAGREEDVVTAVTVLTPEQRAAARAAVGELDHPLEDMALAQEGLAVAVVQRGVFGAGVSAQRKWHHPFPSSSSNDEEGGELD